MFAALPSPCAVDLVTPRLRSADPADWPAHPDWQPLLQTFWKSQAGQALLRALQARLDAGACIYPPQPLRALTHLAPQEVRVLILGQDPYHGPGQAEGLAFSVAQGVKPPPSLRNIHKELQRDLGWALPKQGSLMPWADQGVLLLNTTLTVEDGLAASHAKWGWQALTDLIVTEVARRSPHCVHLLWGAHAQAKADLIEPTSRQHGNAALVLKANHPSPLSALRAPVPFIGCGHFGQTQRWLQEQGVDWRWPALTKV
ncbi:MAG: uracil-DNA glycosylase [Alphaproteobacteria bacterium]|nr:uracil-DNA glycosylase [Alphaproteobacteria bacterium]